MPLNDDRLIEILERWEEGRQRGINISAEELCAECPELIADVERKIAKLEQFRDVLPEETPMKATRGDAADDRAEADFGDARADTPPDGKPSAEAIIEDWPVVPGYELLGELGRGGMGVVYKARQLRPKRLVALKMILAGRYSGDKDRLRLRNDAEALARLQHPHIVQIHEVGEADGKPFLCLELVEGGSLADKLDGTPLVPRRAAELIETLARAMHVAHRCNIVHRDLKPANILLTANNTPKITDFGLAKLLDQTEEAIQSGAIVGTPSYMAPEQADRPTNEISPAADVYALGAVLYELLTGRPPFKAATPLDTMLQVVAEEPVPPRRLQPKVPRDLETIALRCLEKTPDRRFPSAEAMADDLRHFLDGKPVRSRPVGLLGQLSRWCRRKPALATAGGLVVVLLVTALVVPVLFGIQEFQNSQALQSALGEAQYQLAVNLLNQGITDCEQDGIGLGMLHFGLALKNAPTDEPDLHRVIRTNLAAANGRVHSLAGIFGHQCEVVALALSPDGQSFVTGSTDHTARLWRTETGEPLGFPLVHPAEVRDVAFSPDGATVLTGCADGAAYFWDVATGKVLDPPLRHTGAILAVAFGPDGRTVVTGSSDKTAQLWKVDNRERLGPPLQHAKEVRVVSFSSNGQIVLTAEGTTLRSWTAAGALAGRPIQSQAFRSVAADGAPTGPPIQGLQPVAFSPDGRTAVTGGPNSPRFWDMATGQALGLILPNRGWITALAFSPDGKYLLIGGRNRTARLWEIATGRAVGQPLPHRDEVHVVAFGPGGRFVLTASKDKTARLWETTAAKGDAIILPHGGPVRALAFRADGVEVMTGSFDNSVRFWDAATGKPRGPIIWHDKQIASVAYSCDGQVALIGDWDKKAQFWDVAAGKRIGPVLSHPGNNTLMAIHVAISPDGRLGLTANSFNGVRLWMTKTGLPLDLPLLAPTGVRMALFSPDSQMVLTAGGAGPAQLWSVATGRLLRHFPHQDRILAVAFSLDSRTIVTGSADKTARVWSVETGDPLGPPLAHEEAVLAVALSPNGQTVLTGSRDYTACLWDVATGKQLAPALQHQDEVMAVAYSPDGHIVLTASMDSTARLWDAASGKPLGPPLVHQAAIWSARFNPAGDRVLTGSDDGTARLWKVATAVKGDVEQINSWIEMSTGMELDENGVVHVLDAQSWDRRRQRLKDRGGPPVTGRLSHLLE